MGKKKAYQGGSGGGKGRHQRDVDHAPATCASETHRASASSRDAAAVAATVPAAAGAGSLEGVGSGGEESDGSEDMGVEVSQRPPVLTRLCMWEFGQNDPKRDSGSKLRRLGYASLLKIGQSFPGVQCDRYP
jgi:hypothetical protein